MILGAVALAAPAASNAEDTPVTKAMPAHSPIETHIKSLHSALRITAAQEQQWQAVADAMRDSAKNVGALIRDRAANLKTMTAIDDLHSYEAIADAHAAGVKALIPSFEVLYATMSDAQKKNADAVFRHRPRPTVLKTNG
jgi:Spy/CpxP family protein refolding chaperone